jgi:hypothetical protein
MVKFLKIHCLMIVLLALNACTSDTKNQNGEENPPYLHLSTPEQDQQIDTKTEGNHEDQQGTLEESTNAPLPFQDFKERWNAITEERLSNLYIKTLNASSDENGTFYTAQITNKLELRVYVSNDRIHQLEMISKVKTGSEVYTMLESWNQIIQILHPNIEMNDVDSFFHDIGVGPNADLTNVKGRKMTFSGINYTITPTNEGYIFRTSYTNQP